MKKWIQCWLFAGLVCSGFAQDEAPDLRVPRPVPPVPPIVLPDPQTQPIPEPVLPPTIKVEAEKPIELRSLDVEVTIRGLQAETTQTMVFHNPNNRQLAGDLQFPLPDGATVSGYALDVQGRMVDGVVVTKQKARVVLETEQRRGVDPGLVEHVRGNQFNTRVFPIPAKGQRTIRVTYVSELRFVNDDAVYELPLAKNTSIPQLGIELTIAKGPVKPEVGGFGNLTFKNWNDQWQAETTINDAESLGDIRVRLPKLPRSWSAIEKTDNEAFVALIDRPAKFPLGTLEGQPKRFALAWDASGSRSPEAVAEEIALLRKIFDTWSSVKVDLVVLRNQVEEVMHFDDTEKLVAFLEKLPLDGGTDLSLSDFRKEALPHKDNEFWLLVSDGLHTLGDGLPKFDSIPVHCLSAEPERDANVLRFVSAATGARLFDGQRATADDLRVGIYGGSSPQVRIDDPEGILADVQQQQDAVSEVVRVYAKAQKAGEVATVYSRNGKELERRSFNVEPDTAEEGGLLARAWAGHKANALSVFPEENKMELRRLGNRYGLVTPGTSLLVLESLDQYLRHEVEPPASWPEMRTQYADAMKGRRRNERVAKADKIKTVVGWWEKRVAWWEKDFDISTAKKRWAEIEKRQTTSPAASGAARQPAAVGFGDPFGSASPAAREGEPERNEPENMQALEELRVSEWSSGDSTPAGGGFEAPNPDESLRPQRFTTLRNIEQRRISPGAGASDPFAGGGGGGGRDVDARMMRREDSGPSASVALKAWSPDTPYLKAIKEGEASSAYLRYLTQRKEYGTSPAFFLDCAGYILKSDRALGLRVLSNLAEMKIENAALLRVYAWRLQEAGELDRSIELLERVREIRPEEPQSHRDLALALLLRFEAKGDFVDAERAGKLLYEVIAGTWTRFSEIEIQACVELNRMIVSLPEKQRASFKYVDDRLRKNLDVDLRIVLSWDADNTDIDLHVIEPSGERAYYGHNRTLIGGHVSRDFTDGYGPEDYFVRKAMSGSYEIKAKYYGSRQQTLIGPATVTATVFTNYGRPNEKRQVLTLRLDKPNEIIRIGAVQIRESEAVTTSIDKKELKKIEKGQAPAKVVELLGAPHRKLTDGVQIYEYKLADGGVGRVAFGPGVLWVRVVVDGAEIVLSSMARRSSCCRHE